MSVLDITPYRSANLKSIRHWFGLKKDNPDLEYKISEYSATFGLHLVAAANFYGEVFGYTPELDEMIKRLMKHTQVTEVTGQITNHNT